MELIWNIIKQQILIIGHKKGGATLKINKNIIIAISLIVVFILGAFLIIKSTKNTEESRFSTAIEQPFTIDTINVVFNINQDGEHPLLKTYYENNSNKTITNMTLQVKYKNTDTVEDINISGLVSSGEKSKEVLIVGPDSRLVEDVEILKYKISIEDGVYMEYNPITSEYNWS